MNKAAIKEDKRKLKLSTPDNYLRLVLHSYNEYNHKARLDISKILYEKYFELPDAKTNENLRVAIFAEIYSKLMQSLEDLTTLALMFTKNEHPFETYMKSNSREIYKFLGKAKRGLSRKDLLNIYGFKSINDLEKKNLITKDEAIEFRKIYDLIFYSDKGEKERWKGFGRLYTKEQLVDSKRAFEKSGPVSVFQNIKHDYKVLIPNELYFELWGKSNDELTLAVINDYTTYAKLAKKVPKPLEKYSQQKVVYIGTYPVDNETMEGIYSRLFPMAQEIQLIANHHLGLLDDDEYSTRELRFLNFKNSFGEPKSYALCPCGSGKKYKKCHRFKYDTLEDLYYKDE